MTSGIVFDIKEFSVHDGPGIRTTVFLKGCPMRCMWCHNPESQSRRTQIIRSPAGERVAGQEWDSKDLAALLNKQATILRSNGGGITFSGGEPLFQAKFVAEVVDALEDVHIVLDTCGYGSKEDFLLLIARSDLLYYDLKLVDHELHKHYTGVDNRIILKNLDSLNASGKPFHIRVPMIPGVTDKDENLMAIANAIGNMPGLVEVDLLPYNQAAGSKYRNAGMIFAPDFDEMRPLNMNTAIFENAGIKVKCA